MRSVGWVIASMTVFMVAACGGGNKSTASTSVGSTAGGGAQVELVSSSSSVNSATSSTVTLTATVKDANNNVMEGQKVSFSADSGSLQVVAGTTDASGQATALLSAGGNKALRSIRVEAKSGTPIGVVNVNVVGNTLTVAGTPSPQRGQTFTLSFVLKDSGGTPITGVSATISSLLGNGLSATSVPLDYAGSGSVSYTANIAGSDTVRVTAAGVTKDYAVQVASDADFVALSPAANTLIAIGSSQLLTFQYSGAGAANLGVAFSTDRGTLSGASVQTDSDGKATVLITPSNAGAATVTASLTGLGKTVTLPLLFSATTPAAVTVQASPTALPPNASGSTLNQATIEAVVRDAVNNPVANYPVNFAITSGVGGSLSAASAVTDADGKAKVQYIAGSSTSAANGVTIAATAGSASASTQLTINGSAVFISIFRGILMTALDANTYEVPFTVSVVDATGVAVTGREVALSVWPVGYGKGSLGWDATNNLWTLAQGVGSRNSCVNEDTNRDGQLNTGEDVNANGRLDPGLPINLAQSSVTTDSAGMATFKMRYGKQFAVWARAAVTAKATVSGTESSSTLTDWLPILVDDVGDQNVPPAARYSPFGQALVCSDSN